MKASGSASSYLYGGGREKSPFHPCTGDLELLTSHRFKESVSGSKVSMTLETLLLTWEWTQAVLQKTHMNTHTKDGRHEEKGIETWVKASSFINDCSYVWDRFLNLR